MMVSQVTDELLYKGLVEAYELEELDDEEGGGTLSTRHSIHKVVSWMFL